ncbi:MAG: hypothetical protein LLG04_15430 [Parachlamydia sp.]|nr:hypothetical protein [Parachlamydia sp.]
MMAHRMAVLRQESSTHNPHLPQLRKISSSPTNRRQNVVRLFGVHLANQQFDLHAKRRSPDKTVGFPSLTRISALPLRSVFVRRPLSTSVSPRVHTSDIIKNNLNQFQRKSIQEQRNALIVALQREFQFSTEDELSSETMKKFMKFAKVSFDQFSRYRQLLSNETWDEDDWDEALRIMLICYGNRFVEWIDDERKATYLKTAPSIWNSIKIDLYLSKIAEKTEFDKIRATEVIISKLQESAKLHQIRRVIAVYEGVWHGLFLINLYQRLLAHQFSTKIVGTDINPLSVALFSIYAKHIGEVPSKDCFVFFNDVRRPLLKSDLELFDLQTADARVFNLYFRTLIDLREDEVDAILDEKSREMKNDDCLVCTLAEDSSRCQEALKQVGLTKTEEGKHFIRYFHRYSTSLTSSSLVESSVLVLREGMFTQFINQMQKKHRLQIDHLEHIEVAIDLLKGRGRPFQANLLMLKKTPTI